MQLRRFWGIDDHGEAERAGWYAAYFTFQEPYVVVRPLIGTALLSRDRGDEMVGMVAERTIHPADQPEDSSLVFVKYFQRGSFDGEQLAGFLAQLAERGQAWNREILEQQYTEQERQRRDAAAESTRNLLVARGRQIGAEALSKIATDEQGAGPGSGPDAPLSGPLEMAEDV